MINPFEHINWKPQEKDFKSFGKSMLIGFFVIAVIIAVVNILRLPIQKAIILPVILTLIGIFLYLTSLTIPKALTPVYYPWFFISACIGFLISNLLLTAFFYLFFTPFAIGMKLMTGRDPLQLKKKTTALTYWNECAKDKKISKYLKQY